MEWRIDVSDAAKEAAGAVVLSATVSWLALAAASVIVCGYCSGCGAGALSAHARAASIAVLALQGAQDTLEGFMERFGAGASLELHEQPTVTGTTLAALSSSTLVDVVHFSEDSLSRFEPARLGPGVPLYSIDLRLHAKV